MVCDDSFWEKDIFYCLSNNVWFVGDNTTTITSEPSAVKSRDAIQGQLIIPRFVRGHEITQIGFYAFCRCHLLKSGIIEARIEIINTRAFSQSYNIESVRIPSSVQYIYEYVFDIYYYPTSSMMKGVTILIFEPGINLKYIGQHSIAWREYIYLFIGNDINPILHQDAINNTQLFIKSPYSVSFCGNLSETISKELYFSLLGRRWPTKNEQIISRRTFVFYVFSFIPFSQ